tara:strand:- start:835 stop:1203 length:369 start_codon:yes stop_codon:yes gene_type:complete
VVVGNGAVPFLDEFASRYPETILFLTDPSRAAYRAMALQRGLGGLRAAGMLSSSVRAYRAGHRQAKLQGDPWQLGGVFVLATDGEITYAQRSKTAGDHADLDAVIEGLKSAVMPEGSRNPTA